MKIFKTIKKLFKKKRKLGDEYTTKGGCPRCGSDTGNVHGVIVYCVNSDIAKNRGTGDGSCDYSLMFG